MRRNIDSPSKEGAEEFHLSQNSRIPAFAGKTKLHPSKKMSIPYQTLIRSWIEQAIQRHQQEERGQTESEKSEKTKG